MLYDVAVENSRIERAALALTVFLFVPLIVVLLAAVGSWDRLSGSQI